MTLDEVTGSAAGWVDVTLPMDMGMPRWPGDPEFEVSRVCDMSRGDSCNVSKVTLCVHTGTHIDAPCHYVQGGAGVEAAPLDVLMGRGRVLQCDDQVAVRRGWLEEQGIEAGERLFFKTVRPTGREFREDYVYIARDGAEFLVERGVKLLGIDTMSVGGFYDSMVETHVTLLEAGVWVVENVNLSKVPAGTFDIICLPLVIPGCDGAPARVLMRAVELGESGYV